jgi:hypothetical protein
MPPDSIYHVTHLVLGFVLLMGSPHFAKLFFRLCLDTESHPMAVVYFVASALSCAVYAQLILVVFQYVLLHA